MGQIATPLNVATLIGSRIPRGWQVTPYDRKIPFISSTYRLSASGGASGELWVAVEHGGRPSAARKFIERLRPHRQSDRALVFAAPYVSVAARKILENEPGFGYVDATGNAWIELAIPGVFLRDRGAEKNPVPAPGGLQSLKGAMAAKAVRALVDFQPPYGVRQLSSVIARAGGPAVPPYALSRALGLLQHEGLVERDGVGHVVDLDFDGVLRRWAQDYDVDKAAKSVVRLLAPRGLLAVENQLSVFSGQYALTGPAALHPLARETALQSMTLYVDELAAARAALDLVPSGDLAPKGTPEGNVVLIEPSDAGVYVRAILGRPGAGVSGNVPLCRVGYSQLVVDLLTGAGREPAEGEALLERMAHHQADWRRAIDAL